MKSDQAASSSEVLRGEIGGVATLNLPKGLTPTIVLLLEAVNYQLFNVD